jgi:hypothetical protein
MSVLFQDIIDDPDLIEQMEDVSVEKRFERMFIED